MPEQFAVAHRPATAIRSSVTRALLVVFGAAMRVSLRLLEREHPTRIFIEGRLSESIPAVERSLCRGRVCNWLGEAAVGMTALFTIWGGVDFFTDATIGPFELARFLSWVF